MHGYIFILTMETLYAVFFIMLQSLEWRKRIGADELLSWTPSQVLQDYYPGGYAGVDKQGYPVWVDLASFIDFKGINF